jgi:hypothetical protein
VIQPPYGPIASGLDLGEVVPFFGSAASAICRPKDEGSKWSFRKKFFPFGAELADKLAHYTSYYSSAEAGQDAALTELLDAAAKVAPGIDPKALRDEFEPVVRKHVGTPPLALIASFFSEVQSTRSDLDKQLRETFIVDTDYGPLQRTFAEIPAIKLYVTTNYDDLIERALAGANRHPSVLVDRLDKGLWIYEKDTAPKVVNPIDLDALLGDETGKPKAPIVFKLHGSMDRTSPEYDSYLITEEDYVDFLGRAQGDYIPAYIRRLMGGKRLLFLGYSLEDWNVRVILSKLNSRRQPSQLSDAGSAQTPSNEDVRNWAIVKGRNDAEQRVWQAKNLNIYSMDLREFTEKLVAALDERLT